jgi:hypothetical protein
MEGEDEAGWGGEVVGDMDREDGTETTMISMTVMKMKLKRRVMMVTLTTMTISMTLLCVSCHLHADHELWRSEHYCFLDVP